MASEEMKLNSEEFISLAGKILQHAEKVQNNPPEFVPQEGLVADEVVAFLEPYTAPKGPLSVRKCEYVEGRPNVIIRYDATAEKKSGKTISFVGSHMDVVTANADDWDFNPFGLKVEGDKLSGRGITDCLGHVTMITCFFKALAVHKPKLPHNIVAVLIANEENSSKMGIGIDELEKQGELADLKNGWLYWVDSADFGPTLATAGMSTWELTTKGKKMHSGLPHKSINGIELAFEAVREVQRKFHVKYAMNEKEEQYKFVVGTSMKCTQVSCPPGGLNQIPAECTLSGDIRVTPFHKVDEVIAQVTEWFNEIDVTKLPSVGYCKYDIPAENAKGVLELSWPENPYKGVAVDMESPGYKALYAAVASVREPKPFSLTGSLPIIADLQESGFDVQIIGFGRMDAYHAVNEYGYLSEFAQGFEIIRQVIENLKSS